MNDARHEAVTELAERLLRVAEATHAGAPKIVLSADDPDPPPLSWHVAFCSAEVCERLLRLLVLRKVQVTTALADLPNGFDRMLKQTEGEVARTMDFFNIQLAQEL